MSDAVELSATLSRASLPESATETLVYALVRVTPHPDGEDGMPLNAALLIERSPAMEQEGHLQAIQQGLRPVIEELGAADSLAIVLVTDRPKVLLPTEPVFDKEKARRLVAFLDSQPASDRPALADAARLAEDELRKRFSRTAANHVVFISATTGPQDADAERQARMLAEDGFGFSAIGLGAHWNGPAMAHLADAGRGALIHLARAQDFGPSVRALMADLRGRAIGNAKLYFRLAKGVKLRRVFQVSPAIAQWLPEQPTERDAVVRLGELSEGVPRYVLAELVVPPMAAGTYRLATVDVAYERIVPTHQAARAGAVDVVATVGAPGPVDREVQRYVEAMNIYTTLERAQEARRSRDLPKAVQLFRNAHRIAVQAGDTRVIELLHLAAETLGSTQTLPEAITKALTMAARDLPAEH